jgi:hypothetical protein
VLFSDNPRVGTGSNTASYAGVSATASAQGVTAPNYTLDTSRVSVSTDFSNLTQVVSGNVVLTPGSTTGDAYLIVTGAAADTYAAINTAYLAGSPNVMATTLPASSFVATSVDLTGSILRSLIIAKLQNGVRSYQKFAITFNPPT